MINQTTLVIENGESVHAPAPSARKRPPKNRVLSVIRSWRWDAKHIVFAILTVIVSYLVGGPLLYLLFVRGVRWFP